MLRYNARGIDEIPGNTFKKFVIRALAMTFVVQTMMFIGYNIPNYVVGTHPAVGVDPYAASSSAPASLLSPAP
jgi:hypothetical protein